MGTDPTPLWMLIFNTSDQTYSAINFKSQNDPIDYAFKNNLIGVCLVNPVDLMTALNHSEPHFICQYLHEWCTLHRPDPDKIQLSDFFPTFNSSNVGDNRNSQVASAEAQTLDASKVPGIGTNSNKNDNHNPSNEV